MRFGRNHWQWFDLIFIGLAAVVVYPDKLLNWLGERTRRTFGWRDVVLVEMLAIGTCAAFIALFSTPDSALKWGRFLVAVGALATIRAVRWAVARIFGLNE